jgi:hypothetical protein
MLVEELQDAISLKIVCRTQESERQMPVVRGHGPSGQANHALAQERCETVPNLVGQSDREEQSIAHRLPQSTP